MSWAFSFASSDASFFIVSTSRSASLTMRSACCSARPIVSAAIRLRFATHATNTAAPATMVTTRLINKLKLGTTRDVLSLGPTSGLCQVGAALREGEGKRKKKKGPALPCGEVDEPAIAGGTALKAAFQASSLQR